MRKWQAKQQKKQDKQLLEIQSLESDLRALANAAVGVGSRVLKVERQLRTSVVATDSLEPASNKKDTSMLVDFYNSNNQPYDQAIRMAQTGVSVEDIMSVCGLSKSEVELICMMHRLDKAS